MRAKPGASGKGGTGGVVVSVLGARREGALAFLAAKLSAEGKDICRLGHAAWVNVVGVPGVEEPVEDKRWLPRVGEALSTVVVVEASGCVSSLSDPGRGEDPDKLDEVEVEFEFELELELKLVLKLELMPESGPSTCRDGAG